MKIFILVAVLHLVSCGILDQQHEIEHHERATSYQNVHIEHFHPVPTFIKKEYSKLLEHPVSKGSSSSKVEVHHGGKHDHGYAFAKAENNLHGGFGGIDAGIHGHYGVQDQGHELLQHQGQLEQGGLSHYQLPETQNYEGLEAGHVQYDSHDA